MGIVFFLAFTPRFLIPEKEIYKSQYCVLQVGYMTNKELTVKVIPTESDFETAQEHPQEKKKIKLKRKNRQRR